MEAKRSQFSSETRRVAFELWRDLLQMSASTLKRLLAHAKEHPDLPVKCGRWELA
jgi:hypothetical protein